MGTVNLKLVNEELLLEEQSKKFEATILISRNAYRYYLHGDKNQLLAYKEHLPDSDIAESFKLGFLIENLKFDKLSKLNHTKVQIFHSWSQFNLVPKALFDSSQLSNYLQCENDDLDFENHYDYIDIGDDSIILAHGIPLKLKSSLESKYNISKISHIIHPIITSLLKLKLTKCCFVFILEDSFYIVMIDNGEIVNVNFHEFRSSTDLLYYISLNYDSLKFDHQQDPIVISGFVSTEAQIIRPIFSYYSKVSFYDIPQSVVDTDLMPEGSLRRVYNLIHN